MISIDDLNNIVRDKINDALRDMYEYYEDKDDFFCLDQCGIDYRAVDKDTSEIMDQMISSIQENEVIYYSRAMEYLSENDPSLRKSLDLASEYGFSLDNLSSELLATILMQSELSEELDEDDIHNIIDDVLSEFDELYTVYQEYEDLCDNYLEDEMEFIFTGKVKDDIAMIAAEIEELNKRHPDE